MKVNAMTGGESGIYVAGDAGERLYSGMLLTVILKAAISSPMAYRYACRDRLSIRRKETILCEAAATFFRDVSRRQYQLLMASSNQSISIGIALRLGLLLNGMIVARRHRWSWPLCTSGGVRGASEARQAKIVEIGIAYHAYARQCTSSPNQW
jgi:hypothetical protein